MRHSRQDKILLDGQYVMDLIAALCPVIPAGGNRQFDQAGSFYRCFDGAGSQINLPHGMLGPYLTARRSPLPRSPHATDIGRSFKCSTCGNQFPSKKSSPGILRVDVRKAMTITRQTNRTLVNVFSNPNGNYVTLSSETVTFLKSSEKQESQKTSRDWCPRAALSDRNQTKYSTDNRPS